MSLGEVLWKQLSDNQSQDTHDLFWIPFDKVEETLSYESLKTTWRAVKNNVKKLFEL